MSEDEPHYVGHRERLRERFRSTNGEGFQDYEWLELLLTYAIPRGDVKPIAKGLLEKFGSLSAVLKASRDEVQEVKGVGEVTSTFFPLLKLISARYLEEELKSGEALDGPEEVVGFARTRLAGEDTEQFLVVYLDKGNNLLKSEIIEEGTVDQLKLYPRKILEEALEVGCSRLVIVHNHPSGVTEPSLEDEKLTRQLEKSLDPLSLKLIDHIIVTDDGYYSFSENDLLK
ncbi:MAG: hypothetical protein BRC50_04290 [Cyanobacteria bacterium SW_11_48_12]|nr:MAG: hypothetical protein BRC50_04290 [Cyanobacteria bacterium SW_11_48_12]